MYCHRVWLIGVPYVYNMISCVSYECYWCPCSLQTITHVMNMYLLKGMFANIMYNFLLCPGLFSVCFQKNESVRQWRRFPGHDWSHPWEMAKQTGTIRWTGSWATENRWSWNERFRFAYEGDTKVKGLSFVLPTRKDGESVIQIEPLIQWVTLEQPMLLTACIQPRDPVQSLPFESLGKTLRPHGLETWDILRPRHGAMKAVLTASWCDASCMLHLLSVVDSYIQWTWQDLWSCYCLYCFTLVHT